jgi:hypothetical protein
VSLCTKELPERPYVYILPAIGAVLAFTASLIRPASDGSAVRNPLRIPRADRAFWFIASVALLPIDTSDSRYSYWYEFLRLADYFAACDELPPGVSKVKQLFKSAISALSRPPIPAPARRCQTLKRP